MHKLLVPLAAACLAVTVSIGASAQSQADNAAKLAEAHAIIEVMLPTAERQRMTDQMLAAITEPMRHNIPAVLMADAGLKAIVDDFVTQSLAQQRPILMKHMPEMVDAMATAYTHEFSLAELKDIHAFARTPVGSHYLSRSSAIVGDPAVKKVSAAMFVEGQALVTTLIPQFKQKIVDYITAHPEVAAKIQDAAKGK